MPFANIVGFISTISQTATQDLKREFLVVNRMGVDKNASFMGHPAGEHGSPGRYT